MLENTLLDYFHFLLQTCSDHMMLVWFEARAVACMLQKSVRSPAVQEKYVQIVSVGDETQRDERMMVDTYSSSSHSHTADAVVNTHRANSVAVDMVI